MKTKIKLFILAFFTTIGIQAQMLNTQTNSYGGCSWGSGGLEGYASALIPIKTGMSGTDANKFLFVMSDAPFSGRKPTVTILNENMSVWKTVVLRAAAGAPNGSKFNSSILVEACKFPLGANPTDENDPLNKVIAIGGLFRFENYDSFTPFVFLFDWGKMIADGPTSLANQYIGNFITMPNWVTYAALRGTAFASMKQYIHGNDRYLITYNNQFTLKKHSNCGSAAGFNTQALNFFKYQSVLNLKPGVSISLDNSLTSCSGSSQTVSHARDMQIVGDQIYLLSDPNVNAYYNQNNFWITRANLNFIMPVGGTNRSVPLTSATDFGSYNNSNDYFQLFLDSTGDLLLKNIERRRIQSASRPSKLSIHDGNVIVSGTGGTSGFLMRGEVGNIFSVTPTSSTIQFYNLGTFATADGPYAATWKTLLGHELDTSNSSNPIINYYGYVTTNDPLVNVNDNGNRFYYGQVRLNQLDSNAAINGQAISFRQAITATTVHFNSLMTFPIPFIRDFTNDTLLYFVSGTSYCNRATPTIFKHPYNKSATQNPACYAVSPDTNSCNQRSFNVSFNRIANPNIIGVPTANLNCGILNRCWSPANAHTGSVPIAMQTPSTIWLTNNQIIQNPRALERSACSKNYCEPLNVTISGVFRLCSDTMSTTFSAEFCQRGTNSQYTYQWYYETQAIPGATSAAYVITPQGPYLGTYTVRVTNSCGNTVLSPGLTVQLSENLTANAGPDVSSCIGQPVTLTGIATEGIPAYYYNWYQEDSLLTSSPILNINTTVGQSSTYTLIVEDQYGCKDTDEVNVNINSSPIVTAGSDISICNNTQANLNGTVSDGTPAYVYSWSPSIGLDDPSSISPLITLNYTSGSPITNTYTFTVTDANGCIGSDVIDVTVNPLPIAFAGPWMSLCSDVISNLNGSASGGTPGYTYNWSPSNGLVDPSNNTTQFSLNNATSSPILNLYTLSVSDANGCTAMHVTEVTVNPAPIVNAGADISLCSDVVGNLNGNASGGTPAYTYNWSPGTGLDDPNSNTPLISLNNATSSPIVNTYTLIVSDANGCSSSDDTEVTFNPNPIVDAGADVSLCSDVAGNLNGSATGGTPTHLFSWSPATGLDDPNISNPQITLSNYSQSSETSNYTLTVTDANSCVGSDMVNITVNPLPTFEYTPHGWEEGNFCQSDLFLCVIENPNLNFTTEAFVNGFPNNGLVGSQYNSGGAYYWDIDWAQLFLGDIVTFNIIGVDPITGCSSIFTFSFKVNCLNEVKKQATNKMVINGVSSLTMNNSFNLKAYPNPFSSNATFIVEGNTSEKVNLELTDVNGKVVLNTNINMNTNFNFENYTIQDGIYFLKATKGNGEMSVIKVSKIK
jgi:hypothetical protein